MCGSGYSTLIVDVCICGLSNLQTSYLSAGWGGGGGGGGILGLHTLDVLIDGWSDSQEINVCVCVCAACLAVLCPSNFLLKKL